MAATARRSAASFVRAAWLLCLFVAAGGAGPASDLRSQINYVAAALTAGNAADAMTPFSKSFSDYDKLASYFSGLTNAFNITNEIDFADEENTAEECRATIRWSLTLSDLQTTSLEQRSADLSVRLTREKGRWKIVELKPISIFNPSRRS